MNRRRDSIRKYKIVAIVSGVLTGLQLIPLAQLVWSFVSMIDIKVASAIGIIGSADGPTSVVVAHVFAPEIVLMFIRYGFLLLCAATFLVSTVLYFKKRKQSFDD